MFAMVWGCPVGGDDVRPSESDTVYVKVVLTADSQSDAEEAERLDRRLRAELGELELESVERVPSGPAPTGSKAADPVTIGAILVGLSASGGVFTALVGVLDRWLERQAGRHRISVTVDGDTLELDHASPEERRDAVAAFLRRHPVS